MLGYAIEQDIPHCVHRNHDIKGYDMLDARSLLTKTLIQCQELCRLTLGCGYFSWINGPNKMCMLKLKQAVGSLIKKLTSPNVNVYSGPAYCGKYFSCGR